ncbi:MAG: extracellular solute-binding protein, partial [Romboutsia timonensis]
VINVIHESGTYLNFNTININANSKNKDLAYEFINYVLSDEVQERAAKALNDAPINTDVKLNKEDAKNLAYGDIVKNAKTIDYKVVNPLMNDWINKWNRVMN